jgi:hypothetical protein
LPFGFTRHEIIKRIVGYYYSCRSGSQFQDKAIIARGVEHMGVGAEDATAWNRNYTALFAELPGREMKPLLMRGKNTQTIASLDEDVVINTRRLLQRWLNVEAALRYDDINFVAFAMEPVEGS